MAIPWEVANAWLKLNTLQEENFQMNLTFVILLMANKLNLNPVYYKIFEKLSMIEHIYLTSKNQKSLILNYMNLTILGQVAKLNSVYNFSL